MATAKILTRAVRFGATSDPHLLVVIEIDCQECGEYTIVLAGHHVSAVLTALQDVRDTEGDLTNSGDVEVTHRRLMRVQPDLN